MVAMLLLLCVEEGEVAEAEEEHGSHIPDGAGKAIAVGTITCIPLYPHIPRIQSR